MNFSVVNLGCKVNQVEMEQLTGDLIEKGYQFTKDENHNQIAIINTCTVTQKADNKSLATIKKISQKENIKHLFITGCYSELEKNLIKKINDKNTIVAQKDKNNLPTIIDDFLKKNIFTANVSHQTYIPNYQTKWEAHKTARNKKESLNNVQSHFYQHTRAFLKIQDGCNAFCSYCRIPFARGGAVSRDLADILTQVKKINDHDVKEIVLSGINIGTYRDRKTRTTFGGLIQQILKILNPQTKIRISSIEPQSIKEDFLETLSHSQLTPHIHLALQGSSDHILKAMNRQYTLEKFWQLLQQFYSANSHFAISTDIITGYPQETSRDFEQGNDFIRKCGFNKLHVFPFSKRPLTAAMNLVETISIAEKKKRVQTLIQLSRELEKKQVQQLKKIPQRFILEEKISQPKVLMCKINPKIIAQYPLADFDYYKGTSDYYLKGVLISAKDKYQRGDAPIVKILAKQQANPLSNNLDTTLNSLLFV